MTDRPVSVFHRHEQLDSAKPLNPRQELFAQALARGMTNKAACRAAGYGNKTSFHRLSDYPNVKARVDQLLAESAARSVITTQQITDYLLDLVERSKAGQTPQMLQLTRAAVMDLAKVHGLLDPKNILKGPEAPTQITLIRRVVVEPDGRQWDVGR